MARTVYITTFLSGGGSALDGIDGNDMVAGDMAFHINRTSTAAGREGNYMGLYMATTRASTELHPVTVIPDDNAGSWNWELLQPLTPITQTTGKTATLENYGVSVIKTTAASVHQLKRPRRGTQKTIVFNTTSLIKIRLTTAAAAYTVKVGSSCCVIKSTAAKPLQPWLKPTITMVGWSTSVWRITNIVPWSSGFPKLTFSSST